MQIGASDMAFARMNNFSFWLPVAAIMLTASFFVPGGATPPLSLQMGPGMDWPSSPCTSWARPPSWARSTSSSPC